MADADQAQRLLAIFDEQDENGEHRFTDDQVREVIPLLVLSAGLSLAECSAEVQELMGEFVELAQLNLAAPPEKLSADIEAYYAENPVDPELMEALSRFLNEPARAAAVAGWGGARASSSSFEPR